MCAAWVKRLVGWACVPRDCRVRYIGIPGFAKHMRTPFITAVAMTASATVRGAGSSAIERVTRGWVEAVRVGFDTNLVITQLQLLSLQT